MVCCRCNKTGRCRNCSCEKTGNHCQSCLPSRLGQCSNCSITISQPDGTSLLPKQPRPIIQPAVTLTPLLIPIRAPVSLGQTISIPSILSQSCLEELQSSNGEHLTSIPNIPAFTPMANPTFASGVHDSATVMKTTSSVYNEVVQWRRNIFPVPYGNAEKSFVSELSRLFRAYDESSALECIALKAITIAPILLLQKLHQRPHFLPGELLKILKRGDFLELVNEGEALQQRLPKHSDFTLRTNTISHVPSQTLCLKARPNLLSN